MAPCKVLVVGDVDGKVKQLLKKVTNVNKKAGPFDLVLCTGSFFAPDGSADATWTSCMKGESEFPIPIYILGPITPQQCFRFKIVEQGGDLCKNVTYLGPCGMTSLPGGLKLAVLSGSFVPEQYEKPSGGGVQPFYTQADVQKLVAMASKPSFNGVDILLTSRWPDDIARHVTSQVPDLAWLSPDPGAAAVGKALRPRYHLAGGAVYFERQPFRNHEEGAAPTNVTRFIGMAPVANPVKAKWIYAFNITPRAEEDAAALIAQPQNTTKCPYYADAVRIQPDGFRWGGGGGKRPHSGLNTAAPNAKRAPITQSNCWFCLGSPKVEKHLVASASKLVYMALPKGPLCKGHVLIIPVQHIQSVVALDKPVAEGVNKYKAALREYFASVDQDVVFYERNFRSDHMQLQAVPVPKGTTDQIELAVRAAAKRYHLHVDVKPADKCDLSELFDESTPYFTLELPNGQLMIMGISGRFPLQFGREVLAHPTVLNCAGKIDWKACQQAKEQETSDTKDFRAEFKAFDPFVKRK
eukprot:TRINITY_DN12551_c0_g8_i2.p1 TRINITY_DN12551_c0_g8~~TRINITY_DN12551_c0_g8_i2.p1  ORF type:complete len:524 (+),score=105.98 TRINITY_DN12551_c0_g8_i2:2-1573(+)